MFFTDESFFRDGEQFNNRRNSCLRAPKGVIKKNVDPKLIVDDAAYSSRSVMVAIGVPAMGCTQPIFAPAGAKINGKQYKEMIEQSYFPQMSAIAQMRGKGHLWPFQKDNAPSHKTRDVSGSIKKHRPKSFLPWSACSPDLSVLSYFAWGEFKEFSGGVWIRRHILSWNYAHPYAWQLIR